MLHCKPEIVGDHHCSGDYNLIHHCNLNNEFIQKKTVELAAEVLLRSAKDRMRRGEKKKAERKEEAAEARGEGLKAKDLKLAYRMAKWAGGEDGKLTQSQFSLKYSVCNEILRVGRKNFGGLTLSSSLVWVGCVKS